MIRTPRVGVLPCSIVHRKVGCITSMVVVFLLTPAKFRSNDHREDSPHCIKSLNLRHYNSKLHDVGSKLFL